MIQRNGTSRIKTYNMPKKKILDKATFCARGSFNLQTNGIGSTRIAASVKMLGMEFPLKNLFTLTSHLKSPAEDGEKRFQNPLTGVH